VFVKKVGQHAVAALAALSLTASVGAIVAVAPASASSKAPTAYVAELIPTKGNAVTGRFTFTTVLNKSNQEVIEIAGEGGGAPSWHHLPGCQHVCFVHPCVVSGGPLVSLTRPVGPYWATAAHCCILVRGAV